MDYYQRPSHISDFHKGHPHEPKSVTPSNAVASGSCPAPAAKDSATPLNALPLNNATVANPLAGTLEKAFCGKQPSLGEW